MYPVFALACVASVSVWFRGNDEGRYFLFWPRQKTTTKNVFALETMFPYRCKPTSTILAKKEINQIYCGVLIVIKSSCE